jgi:hypothetical protein
LGYAVTWRGLRKLNPTPLPNAARIWTAELKESKMKIDFDKPILGFKGEAIRDGETDFTLGFVASSALLASFPDERDLDGKEKYKRYKLADKISSANGSGVDLSAEEITDLKKLIGKAFAPLVVGRAYDLLDPST